MIYDIKKEKHSFFRKRTLRRKQYGSLLDLAHCWASTSQAQTGDSVLTIGHETHRLKRAQHGYTHKNPKRIVNPFEWSA